MMSKPRGLYIHIPFCLSKCPYCDFYSVKYSEEAASAYSAAVVRNLRHYGGEYDTVYFGGGTPVLLAEKMAEMLRAANIAPNAEITAECNPCVTDERALYAMKNAGVNRISFGVQSLVDSELTLLGRRHNSQQARDAVLLAKKCGFDDISADIMLAVQGQNQASLTQTIEGLAELPLTHISAYMLKIEPATPFGQNPPPLPDEDETADLYALAVKLLAQRDFTQYEISNFAKAGRECRHNLKYWRCEEYLGIGPAAHSFVDGIRFAVQRNIWAFMQDEFQQTEITDSEAGNAEEQLMLGLRLSEGVAQQLYQPYESRLRLIPKNYYKISDGRLSLTSDGFAVSNEIIAVLLSQL
ncbi:MAG: radical SAM family heme chaperone HemW [Oscillospiraceae bacterium]